MSDDRVALPLTGVRVLDLATLAAAPWAAAYLAEFGADVIKVEYPDGGDHQRRWGTRKDDQALFWKSMGRNKRSVTLNLKAREGAELLKRLAARADVVIENFRPGTLERWGVGYDELAAVSPRLVMLRITGFGQTGPYAQRAGFGTLAEALTGFAHTNGQPDGPPTLPNLALGDGVAGLTGAFAVMLALYYRDARGGRGQVIDVSLYEPLLRLLEPLLMDYDQLGIERGRVGSRSEHVAPRNTYRCGDGRWVALSGSAQPVVERMFAAIDQPGLATDPRFATNAARLAHVEELDALIASWVGARGRDEVVAAMTAAGVAIGPVYDIPGVFADPQVQARDSFVRVQDPTLGPMRLVNVVPRLSLTPGRLTRTGPALGEHNAEVYGELGLTEPDLQRLAAAGVI